MSAQIALERSGAAVLPTSPVASISRQASLDTFERRNAAGNPVKSVAHSLAGVASIIRSVPRRADVWDEVDLPDLAALDALHATVEHALGETVAAMRRSGYSWGDIGRALGITRQAAQQRFGGAR